MESENLRIRPLVEGDIEDLYLAVNDPLIWEQHPNKRNERIEFEKFFRESIDSKGALVVISLLTGKIIGSSRYKLFPSFPQLVEIGWSFLAREFWGGPFNREMKDLMLKHAFQSVEAVLFFVDKNNLRSQRAMEKIGGRRIATIDMDAYPPTGPDNFIYMIEKSNFSSLI